MSCQGILRDQITKSVDKYYCAGSRVWKTRTNWKMAPPGGKLAVKKLINALREELKNIRKAAHKKVHRKRRKACHKEHSFSNLQSLFLHVPDARPV